MLLIVYDGECPFCSHYVTHLRLQAHCGPVHLLNARINDSRVEAYWQQGYDLDQGMLAVLDGQVFYGSAAVILLAQLADPEDGFNRLHGWLLARPRIARFLYPVFKRARRMALAFKGIGALSR